MANSLTHILPYPILNARFTLPLSFRVAAGTPTDPTTPDTEFSVDGGASFADCAEEITTGGANGLGYLTLSGAETNNRVLLIAAKSANCVTTPVILHCRSLASIGTGTLSAGSSGGGTLGTLLAYDVTNCFIMTTGGTGGGGTGGANNQARRILTYNTGTGAFTVNTWETTPDATTTYSVLLPEGVTPGMLKALNPATAGRTLVVDAAGLADANMVKLGPSGSGTAQTARDIGASVLLSSGTGTGQVKLASGYVAPNWGDVGNPTTTVNLSGTTVGTITAYTGNTPQTGDSYAIVNNVTSGTLATYNLLNTIGGFVTAIKVKTDFLPSATAGAAGGLLIAGSNAATTFAAVTCTNNFTVSGNWITTGTTTWTGAATFTAGLTSKFLTLNNPDGDAFTITAAGIGIKLTAADDGLVITSAGHAIVLDFQANGIQFTGPGNGIQMDVEGDGIQLNVEGDAIGLYPTTGGYGINANGAYGFVGTFGPATLASFFTIDTTKVYADAVNGSVVKELAVNAGSGLDAAGIRAAIGMASANLDTQLDTTDGTIGSQVSSIVDKTNGLVISQGTIGSVGNSTTTIHLPSLTHADDRLNDQLLVILDVSTSQYHTRWINDWANTTRLATVDTLPFTPANGVDVVWITSMRRDITLNATERVAVASEIFKLDLSTLTGEASRSLLNAIRKLRNRWEVDGSDLIVYKENDSTVAYTQDLTGTPNTDPITSINN